MAADPETVEVVRGHVTEQDILVLIQLLTDSHVQVRNGASSVLVRIGPASIPALEVAASSHEGTALPQDAEALRVITNTLQLIRAHSRPLVSPTPIPPPARK